MATRANDGHLHFWTHDADCYVHVHFRHVHLFGAHSRVPGIMFYLAKNLIALYHSCTARLMMLQPYELPITEFLKPVWDVLRHYVGVDVYFQSQKLRVKK